MTAVGGPAGSGGAHEHGSLGEEAGRLFEAVQDLLGDRLATGSTECRLCPVCQLIGLLRTAQPAVAEHLADAVTSLLAAYRAVIEAHEQQWAAKRPSGRATGVEHIDIDVGG